MTDETLDTTPAQDGQEAEPMIPYARFRSVVDKVNALKAELEAEPPPAPADEVDYKALYEEERAKGEQIRAQTQAMQLDNLRHQVAADLGLPATLADRLQGATYEELEADALTLIDTMPEHMRARLKPSAPTKTVWERLGLTRDQYAQRRGLH